MLYFGHISNSVPIFMVEEQSFYELLHTMPDIWKLPETFSSGMVGDCFFRIIFVFHNFTAIISTAFQKYLAVLIL